MPETMGAPVKVKIDHELKAPSEAKKVSHLENDYDDGFESSNLEPGTKASMDLRKTAHVLKAPPSFQEPDVGRDYDLGGLNEMVKEDEFLRGNTKRRLKAPPSAEEPKHVREPISNSVSGDDSWPDNFAASQEAIDQLRNFKPVVLEHISNPEERARQESVLRAIDLKEKYYFGMTAAYKIGLNSPADAEVMAAMPYIADELLHDSAYVTDIAGASSEVLKSHEFVDKFGQDPDLMQTRFNYLGEIVGKIDAGDMAELRMQAILSDVAKFAEGKTIYARDGLEAVSNMLDDGLLMQHIIERRAVQTLLVNTEIRVFLRDQGYHVPESPDKDVADHLGDFLIGMEPEDRDFVLEEYKKCEIQVLDDYLRLKLAVDNHIQSNEFKDCDLEDADHLPIEIKILMAERPDLKDAIEELDRQGVFLSLRRRTNTDPEIIDAIQNISTMSQQSYTETWLRQFILDGKKPLLKMTENGKSKAEQMKEDGNEVDLEADLELIKDAINNYLELTATSELDSNQAAILDQINTGLSGMNNEWAANRMQFDLSDEQSNEAQAMLKKMLVLGPLAHGLEHFNLGYVAKFITGTGVDVGSEMTEIQALRGAGLLQDKKELVNRLAPLLPIFAGASFLSVLSEKMIEENKTGMGGLAFGVSAAALSLATCVMSMKMYKNNYMELVQEGKIADSFIAQNEEFKNSWAEFSSGMEDLDDPEKIRELLRNVVESIDDTVLDKDAKAFLIEQLGNLSFEEIEKAMSKNVNKEAWKKAIAQDFKNPLRLGLLLGSLAVPLLGGAIGQLFPEGMHNGAVLAGIGTIENMAAGLTMFGARAINGFSYERRLQKRLDSLNGQEESIPVMAPQYA